MSWLVFVCSRYGTGGAKEYVRLHPEWMDRKVGSKITKCPASLTVKTYMNTETILGIYDAHRNHPIGDDNLRYLRISGDTREWIAGIMQLGVKATEITSLLFIKARLLNSASCNVQNIPFAWESLYNHLDKICLGKII